MSVGPIRGGGMATVTAPASDERTAVTSAQEATLLLTPTAPAAPRTAVRASSERPVTSTALSARVPATCLAAIQEA